MSVTVRMFAAARSAASTSEAIVSSGSLDAVAKELVSDFPNLEAVLPRCSFLLNGVAVHGDLAEVEVPDGAELDVLPPFAGG